MEYRDPHNLKASKRFRCDITAVGSKEVCLFHDKTFLQDKKHPDNMQLAIDVFTSLIRDKNSDSSCDIIECVGYHLPDIEIREQFTKPIFFIKCKFLELDFSRSCFREVCFILWIIFPF